MFDRNTDRRGFPGGLRVQLLLGLLVLVIGTMALVALIGVHLTRRQVKRSELQRTVAGLQTVAAVRQSDAGRTLVGSVRKASGLQYVKFEFPTESESFGRRPDPVESQSLFSTVDRRSGTPRVQTERFGGEMYAVATMTLSNDENTEWNAVGLRSLESAQERIDAARSMLLMYLGVDALFIFIVGYAFLTFLVVRPIRAIGVATNRAARGDLASHIEILPPNEFGRVGRSFNRMLDELRENRRELEERLEELDEAYRELEQTQESLIRSEKLASVGQLAAGVAHEIGNPLSAISGFLDCFEEMDLDEDERDDLVERMQEQVDRIQTIIRDLLDFSRSDSEDPVENVQLRECIDDAVDLLAPQPRSREIDVNVDVPDGLPEVRGNHDQITQVLINLLMNAADAIKSEYESGTIDVEAAATEEGVRLAVSDDGPGIPPDETDRIFDPFYTTKDPGEGTGLGLAISHRIMERFDGSIELAETSESGTTFALLFRPVSNAG